ncbi:MAG: PAS domain-containing sensor histidine kinase [Pseudomonadales bacterium]|nr:PAS domain-containing sensor histidine kinase [Pseudomonadales bacterium]MBO7007586.1 PAS domain-containing sensor histidine kinase [Pseudomonadales bacterium]
MKQFDQSFLEEQQKAQRATIFRVYNYYRVLIAFLFLFLFLDPNLNTFVGQVNPELFRGTILTYIVINSIIGVATLFLSVNFLARPVTAIIAVVGDIIALTFLMSASGGVSSGLGNFLFFTLAFAGGMIHGRVSTVLPAIAFILTIYNEFYLFFLGENNTQAFFQAGLLGIVYFVTNILFQTLSRQLRSRQSEVFTLEQINNLIIEGMPTGVVVLNNDREPRFMNQAAERYLAPQNRVDMPEVLLDSVDTWKKDPLSRSVTINPGNGVELVASFSELNTPVAETLVFLEDSTEVQRQAQQLKLASLGRLSASIAHEIRNPLGAISHAAQLLGESENLDKADARLCEIIQNHSVRMNDVIENVLQLSRRRAAEPRDIVLDEWLRDFLVDFETGYQGAPIQIDTQLSPNGVEIKVDPLHLSQVMANLCQNGLRYSKKKTGEAKLTIRGGRERGTNTRHLEIIDYGDGVSEELEANLFEPFYTTETKGTGLGLYISKELCASNDANLSYSRAETGGSSFKITFVQD